MVVRLAGRGYSPHRSVPKSSRQTVGEVLAKPKARAILLSTDNLAAAYAEVETQGFQFEKSLIEAHQSAGNALKNVTGFEGTDVTLVQVATELADTSKVLLNVMTEASERAASKK